MLSTARPVGDRPSLDMFLPLRRHRQPSRLVGPAAHVGSQRRPARRTSASGTVPRFVFLFSKPTLPVPNAAIISW